MALFGRQQHGEPGRKVTSVGRGPSPYRGVAVVGSIRPELTGEAISTQLEHKLRAGVIPASLGKRNPMPPAGQVHRRDSAAAAGLGSAGTDAFSESGSRTLPRWGSMCAGAPLLPRGQYGPVSPREQPMSCGFVRQGHMTNTELEPDDVSLSTAEGLHRLSAQARLDLGLDELIRHANHEVEPPGKPERRIRSAVSECGSACTPAAPADHPADRSVS